MAFRQEVAAFFEENGVADAATLLEVPPDQKLGDYALPCFTLAKERREAPAAVAAKLAAQLSGELPLFIRSIVPAGPYVNVLLDPGAVAGKTLSELGALGADYGRGVKQPDTIMIEYSQPNTHKAFHVGHLRGTSIGESLARLLRFAGYSVIQANYSGDTGSHIGKWLWYYTTYDNSPPPRDRRRQEDWLAEVYVKAIQAYEQQPEAEAAVSAIIKALERKEPGRLYDIYRETRQLSIDCFTDIYEELQARFDHWFFESEVEERGKLVSRELVERGIAVVDQGATIVNLEDEKLGVWVLLRKDGTALYSAKDIALAEIKFNTYHVDRSLYVVGAAQTMHLRQLFTTLHRMGFPQAGKCFHVPLNEVRLPEGKMSSRTGQNLLYRAMREEVSGYAEEEVRARHPDWAAERIAIVAHAVSIASLKYPMLTADPNKSIVFDAKKAASFEGDTGPYLLYTYARAQSILRKAGREGQAVEGADVPDSIDEKEYALVRAIGAFPYAIGLAATAYAPHELARYAMQTATVFNSFYHDVPVLTAEGTTLEFRLSLVQATVAVLGKALELLGLDAPSEL